MASVLPSLGHATLILQTLQSRKDSRCLIPAKAPIYLISNCPSFLLLQHRPLFSLNKDHDVVGPSAWANSSLFPWEVSRAQTPLPQAFPKYSIQSGLLSDYHSSTPSMALRLVPSASPLSMLEMLIHGLPPQPTNLWEWRSEQGNLQENKLSK